MKFQTLRQIGWPILLLLFVAALLSAGTRPTAAQGPLPDKFLFAIGRLQAPVGQFADPSGVAVAPDGTVYVADPGNHRIQRFSATGQFLGTWGSWGDGDGQFGCLSVCRPSNVAVAPDGTVYMADSGNHRIQRFSATGQFLGKWGSRGSGDGQFNYPKGVAVGPDGTVYVADTDNHRIQRFSATSQFLGKWGSGGRGDGQFLYPEGVAVAPDGTVYVAEGGRIQRFSATGQFLGKWGSWGSGDGQFNYPESVAVAPDGTVYVADTGNDRIQRFDATGRFLGKWGSEGSGDWQFNYPSGVAVAPDGTVYVADSRNHRIQRFSATGQFLGKWGSQGSGDQEFGKPSDVAVAPDGTVYVANSLNHRIQRFSATGLFLGMWGNEGSDDGQFESPGGVAVAPDGTVYVADRGNDRIQRFSATGQFLGKWGSFGSGDGQFDGPSDVAVAPDGTVYVADNGNHRIQRFSATGQFLGQWGSEGLGDGQFYAGLSSVAVAPDGTVYITSGDYAVGARIQRFSATGEFLGGWAGLGWTPSGVAVSSDGMVYVTEYWVSISKPEPNYRFSYIMRFSATGQFLGTWGSGGFEDGQFLWPEGVAVAPDGTVYVADTQNYRIQAFGTVYPDTWRGEYFANRWLAERPAAISQSAQIDFDWGTGAPDPALPADSFSARFQRYVWFEAGFYQFTLAVDEGAQLWVDDRLLVDQWEGPAGTYSAPLFLTTGHHRVRLEYNDLSGPAAVHLQWEFLAPPLRVYLPLVMVNH